MMDVHNFEGEHDVEVEEWFSNDRIQLSENNVVFGYGKYPKWPVDFPTSALDAARNSTWKPYKLENGCQAGAVYSHTTRFRST